MEKFEKRLAKVEFHTLAQTKILTEICRDTKANRKDAKAHELEDERRFGKLETEIKWHRRVGIWAMTAVGLGHLLK